LHKVTAIISPFYLNIPFWLVYVNFSLLLNTFKTGIFTQLYGQESVKTYKLSDIQKSHITKYNDSNITSQKYAQKSTNLDSDMKSYLSSVKAGQATTQGFEQHMQSMGKASFSLGGSLKSLVGSIGKMGGLCSPFKVFPY